MALDDVMAIAARLNAQAEALAALGAWARASSEGLATDPRVSGLIDDAVDRIAPGARAALTSDERALVASAIRAFFMQASDLLAQPARAPGWVIDDPQLLQAQGRTSALIAPLVAGLGLPGLEARMAAAEAHCLDIGCGVGALSVAMCRQWPATRVVGLDPWQVAMRLAQQNVAAAGLGDRIELRQHGIEQLDEEDAFDLVFVPGPFLPPDVLAAAWTRIARATRPGGWVVLGLYAAPPDPLAHTLMNLRIVRSGGAPITSEAGVAMVAAAGFAEARAMPRTWSAPMAFVVGRKA